MFTPQQIAQGEQMMRNRQTAMQNMPQGLNSNQQVAYAMANHINPTQMGLTNQQINYGEQGNMGSRWNNATGRMESTTGQPYMANAGNGGGAINPGVAGGSMTGTVGSGQMPWNTPGSGMYNPYGKGGTNGLPLTNDWRTDPRNPASPNYNPAYQQSLDAAASSHSTLPGLGQSGGGSGFNPYGGAAGPGGLAGSAGNALRNMFMGSQQFNPNGANTYAIQNMNLSGQGGGLGSTMGGIPRNTQYGSAEGSQPLGQMYPSQTQTATSSMGMPSYYGSGQG